MNYEGKHKEGMEPSVAVADRVGVGAGRITWTIHDRRIQASKYVKNEYNTNIYNYNTIQKRKSKKGSLRKLKRCFTALIPWKKLGPSLFPGWNPGLTMVTSNSYTKEAELMEIQYSIT